jgi:Uncharacterized protein conserved in bacteria with the myosin-like domain
MEEIRKMKDFLKKLIKERRSQVETLEKAMVESDSKEERASHNSALVQVRQELKEAETELAKLEEAEKEAEKELEKENEELEKEAQQRSLRIRGSYGFNGGITDNDSMEAREKKLNEELEARGKALKEKRAVTIDAGQLLVPQHQGRQLNDTFNQVSTLVDQVSTENLQGGESYKEAYVKSYGTGGITGEGKDYTTAEPQFGYAPMNKVKITAYAEISEEVKKLPNIDYARKVEEACRIAVKKKLSQQILTGKGISSTEGADDEMVGIFASPVAIDSTKDVDITAIDINTLNEAVFSYGGDEDVETQATLILNKKTLKALSEVRKSNGDPAYIIDVAKKTINTIPYVINSNVLDFATAKEGEFIGAYGDLKAYKAPTFSSLEIQESSDFKFKQGMICYKVSVFVAGNVIKQDGFLRLKKKVTA